MTVTIIGAGVAGLTCACELLDRGIEAQIVEQSSQLGESACSWFAGGMLAPWCEKESAEQVVVDLGVTALSWWDQHINNLQCKGSLVLSMERDKRDIERFARLTENHRWLNSGEVSELEPDLAGRCQRGLYFADEAYMDPRDAMQQLADYLQQHGVEIQFGQIANADDFGNDRVIDCRGFAARDQLPQMRGVKGEMIVLKSADISLGRAVRLVHPRYPIYIVPRGNNHFMLGATMIENEERHRITARSMLELLSAAYALHPALAEAEIVETGVDLRPSFTNNLPTLFRRNNTIYINGLYRHGFLLAPAMAIKATDAIVDEQKFQELQPCASS